MYALFKRFSIKINELTPNIIKKFTFSIHFPNAFDYKKSSAPSINIIVFPPRIQNNMSIAILKLIISFLTNCVHNYVNHICYG